MHTHSRRKQRRSELRRWLIDRRSRAAALTNIDAMSPNRPASIHPPTDRAPSALQRPLAPIDSRPLVVGATGFDKSDKGRINLYVLALHSNHRASGLRRPESTPARPGTGRAATTPRDRASYRVPDDAAADEQLRRAG